MVPRLLSKKLLSQTAMNSVLMNPNGSDDCAYNDPEISTHRPSDKGIGLTCSSLLAQCGLGSKI